MRRLALALLLAGCARELPAPPAAFRNTAAPIYSNAVFDASRLAGEWRQVGGFGAGCRPGRVRFDGGTMDARLCLNGQEQAFSGPFAVTGPGRILPPGGVAEWWVIWIDVGERSMAIGTPSGQFGFLLDREGPIPPDRLAAAREIFDWNGYDLGAFRPY